MPYNLFNVLVQFRSNLTYLSVPETNLRVYDFTCPNLLACHISPRSKGEGVIFDLLYLFHLIFLFAPSRRFEATQTGTLVLTDFYNT